MWDTHHAINEVVRDGPSDVRGAEAPSEPIHAVRLSMRSLVPLGQGWRRFGRVPKQLLLAAALFLSSSESTDGKLRVEDYLKLTDKRERGHRSSSQAAAPGSAAPECPYLPTAKSITLLATVSP